MFSKAGGGAAWDGWLRPLLTSALDAAPLDLMDAWAAALRYSVAGLATAPAGMKELLAVITGMAEAGA